MAVILPVLLLGLMASLSPSTIVVFILLLLGTQGSGQRACVPRRVGTVADRCLHGASYALGASQTSPRNSHTAVEVAELLLGILLIGVAVREWRRKDTPAEKKAVGGAERFTGRLKGLKPWGAVVVGILKQPWAITAAAALVVVDHDSDVPLTVIAFACFTAVSTATVALIFLYYARSPEEARAGLAVLQERVIGSGARGLRRGGPRCGHLPDGRRLDRSQGELTPPGHEAGPVGRTRCPVLARDGPSLLCPAVEADGAVGVAGGLVAGVVDASVVVAAEQSAVFEVGGAAFGPGDVVVRGTLTVAGHTRPW